jgi:hypothetical protein
VLGAPDRACARWALTRTRRCPGSLGNQPPGSALNAQSATSHRSPLLFSDPRLPNSDRLLITPQPLQTSSQSPADFPSTSPRYDVPKLLPICSPFLCSTSTSTAWFYPTSAFTWPQPLPKPLPLCLPLGAFRGLLPTVHHSDYFRSPLSGRRSTTDRRSLSDRLPFQLPPKGASQHHNTVLRSVVPGAQRTTTHCTT